MFPLLGPDPLLAYRASSLYITSSLSPDDAYSSLSPDDAYVAYFLPGDSILSGEGLTLRCLCSIQ